MAKHRRYVRQMPKIYGNLQKPKRSLEPFLRFLRRLLWLGVIAGLVYVGLFSGWFTVRKVEVQGTHFTSADEIKKVVPTGNSIWFVSEDSIKSKVLVNPTVEAVALFRGLPDSLRVVVKERQPTILWISGDTTSVLDEAGLAFAQYKNVAFPAPDTELGLFLAGLPKVQDTKALPVTLNHEVISSAFLTFVAAVQKEVGKNLPQVTFDHLEIADTSYDVTFIAKEGLRVQFNSLADPGVQVRNLTRLIHQNKVTLTSRVDLRIDRWAYVL